ncbi:recombinase family protein [Streptomyces kronopolitis]|uniref:recombinase family protein n=1 Tax=Streptomyces kronopolitis TaxID=1612435 RepID=UPI00341ED256
MDGDSPVQLAKDLYERGEKTAEGRDWNAPRVRDLLDNRHVTGIRVFRGEEIGDGEWPAIIDRGRWLEAQQRRTYRAAALTANDDRPSRFYLLRGIVVCTGCGKPMGGGGTKYVCNHTHRLDIPRCNRAVKASHVEEFVTEAALYLLERLDLTEVPTLPLCPRKTRQRSMRTARNSTTSRTCGRARNSRHGSTGRCGRRSKRALPRWNAR